MYKLYRRNGSKVWQFRINRTGIRRTTGTEIRDLAEQYAKKESERYFKEIKLGEKPRKTWKEAAIKRLKTKAGIASSHQDRITLRWLDRHLRDKYLDEITPELVDELQEKCAGLANATVNRRIQLVGAILREEGFEVMIKRLPEPKRRVRWLTKDEAARLLLTLPPHLADMAQFTLSTGLRMSNVTRLEWSQVDLDRRMAWIHPDQAKARKAIPVPLNAEAVIVLRKQAGKHTKFVFTFDGNPVRKVNGNAWRKALFRAGIEDFRWHDLRHTWASWHVQNGTPAHVLMELGGWSDPRMVQRYAHLAAEHLAEYADKLSRPRIVHKSEHTGNTAEGNAM